MPKARLSLQLCDLVIKESHLKRRTTTHDAEMKYRVLIIPSDQGFAVGCPLPPGCWSQGRTREEALVNIRDAIRLWLEVAEEDLKRDAMAEQGELEEVVV